MKLALGIGALAVLGASSLALAADGSNVRSDDVATESPAIVDGDAEKGDYQVGKWLQYQDEYGRTGGSIPGNIYIGKVTFGRNGTSQQLWVETYIPQCQGGFGQQCQRQYTLHLQCRDRFGNTRTLYSPYQRNYSTNGMETKYIAFSSPEVQYCDDIDYVDASWIAGW